ncbi:ATP-binding protein [Caulobacter segnis]|uniref:Transcriptional regulator, winged helix family n=2 Tax=Caulobacter segnis TaxID=88688 RepID=D5VK41_CAUST|nr:winged helix-turn-helix domain-containing protein [Caulobacter segnis]ADG10864.1 transcriptional regulator, winged helix family [Caulobacter segnis ATCC 21756]
MADDHAELMMRSFAFGPFLLLPGRQLLLEGETPVRIGNRALGLLTALVERAGEVVTKRELFAKVWPDTIVEEGNLKVHMVALRRVLRQEAGTRYISTVIGRGYCFVAPVRTLSGREALVDRPVEVRRAHNLPAGAARLLGREDVVGAIREELGEARLVSVVGPGGIGKTSVALAVAERMTGVVRDGVWFVDLSPIKDPTLVASAVATAIGLAAHSANMLAALSEYLRDREMLLLFDSCECEHIIDTVAMCAERILTDAPGVRILTTSREPLRLAGERLRRLPGLAAPPASTTPLAREALSFAAVRLFVERASDRLETFALSDSDAPIVAEICRRLDGLPLAIELAATRIDMFGAAGVLDQVRDRFHLQIAQRAGPERHRTLMAAIDWSYDLLPANEQAVLRRLSVLAGTFNLASACAIVADDAIGSGAVVGDLAALVDKSLVVVELRDLDVEYRLLDTTRAYALEKLLVSGEADATGLRHARHFLGLADQARRDVGKLPRTIWLQRYGARIDDVREALRWAASSADDAGLVISLTIAAIAFWGQLSLLEECRAAVERALDPRLASVRAARDDLVLNLTLGATLLHTQGPLLAVKEALTRALDIAEGLGETELQLECLRGLSEYELWTGDSHSALQIADKISCLEGKSGGSARTDADGSAGSALSWLGALAASQARLESIVYRSAGLDSRSGSTRFDFDQRLTARGALATVLWLRGFPDQAVETARVQLAEAEASNYAVSLCYALVHGSLPVALYVRDYVAAQSVLSRALRHAERHGLVIWSAMAACVRARLDLYLDRPIDLESYRQTLAVVRESGFRMRYPNYLTNYGEALARQVDLRSGLAAIDEAMAVSEANGQVVGIPEMLRIKGNVLRRGSAAQADQAVECYLRSIALARRDGALSWELRSAATLVAFWRSRGGDDEAEATLAMALERFTEGFDSGDLRRARALVDTRPRV